MVLTVVTAQKGNPALNSNSRVIKNYYIRDEKYLLDRYKEIKELCNHFNARASLRLNKRSFEKVAFKTMQNVANSMSNKEYSFIRKSYDRACGATHNDKVKKWIVDIDKDDLIWTEQIINAIQPCMPKGDKLITTIPSKTGKHLITTPFNIQEFKENFKQELKDYQMDCFDIEIHKDNPVNLYIP